MFKYFLIWLMVLRSYGNTANETKQSFRTIKSPLHDKKQFSTTVRTTMARPVTLRPFVWSCQFIGFIPFRIEIDKPTKNLND